MNKIVILFLIGIVCCSCSVIEAQKKPEADSPPASGPEQLYKAVQKSNWLVTVSIIGISISVFALLNGSRAGFAGIVACSVNLYMALATARYAQVMALLGLAGSILLGLVSILVKNKALKELIMGIQNLKKETKENKLTIGPYDITDIVKAVQSYSTKKIVSEIKGKMKLQEEKKGGK